MDDKSGRARGLHKLRSGKQRVAGCGIFFGLIINLLPTTQDDIFI